MLRAAVADDDPCLIIESRALYPLEGDVDLGRIESVAGASLRRSGSDAVIITWGTMMHRALEASDLLATEGISAGVLDLRWLAPLDDAAIAAAVRAAGGRVVVAHEANRSGGFGAEVAARIAEHLLDELDAPVVRVATPDVRMPASPVLQAALIPSAETIVASVRELGRAHLPDQRREPMTGETPSRGLLPRASRPDGSVDPDAWVAQPYFFSERTRGKALYWPAGRDWFANDPLPPIAHSHPGAAEVYFVVEGNLEVTVGSTSFVMGELDFCLIPTGAFHDPFGTNGTDCCMWCVVAPNWRGHRLQTEKFGAGRARPCPSRRARRWPRGAAEQ